MRFFLFLVLLASVLPASAQIYVNKIDVNNRPVQYIEVWDQYNKSNEKFFAMLDYGQQDDLKDKEGKHLFVTNQEGQFLEFNGIVDVLNFMYRNGWEVLHVKTIDDVQSYILRKRKGYSDNAAVPSKKNKESAVAKIEKTAIYKKTELSDNKSQKTAKTEPLAELKRSKDQKTPAVTTKEKKK